MKLRITAYDKDNNVLFLNDNFDGDVFYNGLPNTLGIDIFRFYITPERNRDFIDALSKEKLNSCVASGNGGWECTQWIIVKGNMDYLDCPGNYNWTKNKCNK